MTVSIIKSRLPPLEEWEECEIVECIGTPEEHADKFYRYRNFGVEVHDDGLCQAYVIVEGDEGEEPIMVKEGLSSPEEAIEFLNEESNGKSLSDTGSTDEEPEAVAEVEVEVVHEPEAEEDEEKDKDSEEEDMSEKVESISKSNEAEMPEDVEVKCSESSAPMTDAGVQKAVETTAHSGTVQEAESKGQSNGGLDDITYAGTVQEAESHGESNGGLDDITHAKKVTLPAAQQVSMEGVSKTEPTFKSFADMRAEREGKKQRGLPTGYTPYNEATIRKTACDNAQRLSFGKGKDYNNIQDWDEKKLGSIDGVSRKTSVSGFAKSAPTEGLMPFSEMRSIMKSGNYSAGTMKVEYAPISKAHTGGPEETPEEEPLPDAPVEGPDAQVPADGMPVVGGDGTDAVPGAEDMSVPEEGSETAGDIASDVTGDLTGENTGEEILPPEQAMDMYASASPVVQMVISSILIDAQSPATPGEEEDAGLGGDVSMDDGLAGSSDMGTALEGSDVGAPAPVSDPLIANKEKPQLPGM